MSVTCQECFEPIDEGEPVYRVVVYHNDWPHEWTAGHRWSTPFTLCEPCGKPRRQPHSSYAGKCAGCARPILGSGHWQHARWCHCDEPDIAPKKIETAIGPIVLMDCRTCGKTVPLADSNGTHRTTPLYCSPRCRKRGQRAQQTTGPGTATCRECGTSFQPGRKDASYCSNRCRQRAYRGRTKTAGN